MQPFETNNTLTEAAHISPWLLAAAIMHHAALLTILESFFSCGYSVVTVASLMQSCGEKGVC